MTSEGSDRTEERSLFEDAKRADYSGQPFNIGDGVNMEDVI